jgi:hypothetical protein
MISNSSMLQALTTLIFSAFERSRHDPDVLDGAAMLMVEKQARFR